MPTIVGTPTTADVRSASSISVDLPTNDVSHRLVAIVSAAFAATSPTATFTLTGWTQAVIANADPAAATAVFQVGGGLTGPIAITLNKTADDISVVVIAVADNSQTTPIEATSTGLNSSTLTQSVSSLTTLSVNALLIASWGASVGAGGAFNFIQANNDLNDLVNIGGVATPFLRSINLLVATGLKATAGATGAKTARSYNDFNSPVSASGAAVMVALKSFEGPTIPALTYPIGGESLTAGAVVNITWTASTSPTALASTLKYNIDYSANYGSSWTSIVALTSTGVVTYPWTVPATIGNGYLIRIRANDPALSLYSLNYDISGAFSVVTEAAVLGAPVITAPVSGSVNNKAVNVTVSWQHQGGPGNPQVAFTLQWANNVAFSGPTTVGPTTTGTQSTSIDFSAQTSGTTIYVKVKTQGVSVYSAYSSIRSFVVGSLPATPNITAPTAGSPPTVPLPTVTFTEADTFVSRKMRITQGGSEVYNSGDVVSSALSFVSPFSFSNGVAYSLFLSVKNPLGLSSAEDSETFTAAYTGPATPTLAVTAVNDGGYVSAAITNSDTPSYNELWRYVSTAAITTAIKVGASIPVDGSFADYHVASGVTYKYFARAYAVTGLFSDSAVSSAVGVTLPNVFLHAVSRTSTSGNTDGQAISLLNTDGRWSPEEVRTSVGLLGRPAPASLLGQAVGHRLSVTAAIILYAQVDDVLEVWRKQETGSVVCVRDNKGNRVFGKMTQPSVQDQSSNLILAFEVVESAYTEGL